MKCPLPSVAVALCSCAFLRLTPFPSPSPSPSRNDAFVPCFCLGPQRGRKAMRNDYQTQEKPSTTSAKSMLATKGRGGVDKASEVREPTHRDAGDVSCERLAEVRVLHTWDISSTTSRGLSLRFEEGVRQWQLRVGTLCQTATYICGNYSFGHLGRRNTQQHSEHQDKTIATEDKPG